MPRARAQLLLLLAMAIQQGSTSDEVTPMTVVGWIGGQVILPCAPQKQDRMYSSHSYPCWYYKGDSGTNSIWNCGSMDKFSSRLSTSNSYNLHISSLQRSDAGLYIYVSNNRLVWKVNLTITDDATTSADDLQFVVGVKGRSVILPCFASYPGKSFSKSSCWYNNNTDIYCWSSSASYNRFGSRLTAENNYNIKLSNLTASDAGTFTCQRSSTERGQLKLIVRNVGASTPVIIRSPDKESVNYGTTVNLTCHSEQGSWPISYSWSRLDPGTGRYVSMGAPRASLLFPSAQVSDSGEYMCVASNGAEEKKKSATVRLSVQSPIDNISLTLTPQQLFTFEGQPLVLRCRVGTGSEPIFWTWLWIPDQAKVGSKRVVGDQRDLWLKEAGQSGQYMCSARNQYDGRNVTLESSTVTVHIVPNPDPHPLVWAALGLSGFVLLVFTFLCCKMHIWVLPQAGQTHTPKSAAPMHKGKTEMKTMSDSLKSQSKRRGYEPGDVYEDKHDQFYCPLSGDQRMEDVYDDLS
ncbi:hypothetical protein MATL_G00159850 [Megalops atlanticus]|uniref:Ig-like domain-containing protein n=1 Tax=Megalops atlanticus TaxID=7932 RepID=A0A9D3PQC3_MEGAT|nr:hypothetical protein MATL_G00159850 [Megalops atlanticus]